MPQAAAFSTRDASRSQTFSGGYGGLPSARVRARVCKRASINTNEASSELRTSTQQPAAACFPVNEFHRIGAIL